MDHPDATCLCVVRRAESQRFPAPAQLSLVRRERTRQDADERRLAGAILADERMDLAGMEIEIDAIERANAGERFPQPPRGEERRLRAQGRAAVAVSPAPARSESASTMRTGTVTLAGTGRPAKWSAIAATVRAPMSRGCCATSAFSAVPPTIARTASG